MENKDICKCEYCGACFDNGLTACPVCFHSAKEGGALEANIDNYPILKRKSRALEPIHIYTIAALIVIIAAGIMNIFLLKEYKWSIAVLILAICGWLSVINITGAISFTAKVLNEIIFFQLALFFVTFVTKDAYWYLSYAMPIVFQIGYLTQFALMVYTHKRFRPHYISTSLIASLSFISILTAYINDVNLTLPLAISIIAVFIIVISLILGGKRLAIEAKGRFSL